MHLTSVAPAYCAKQAAAGRQRDENRR
jgi:hypothetical protein